MRIPGHPNVGVGIGGQVFDRTDTDGYALVPRLAAYRANPIRIDPNELPFSAEVDTIELDTVPSWRSVTEVVFPVRSGRGALIRITLEDGQPAPAGAVVRIEGEERDFYVARRGEAFITGLADRSRLRLVWKGASCPLDVELPPTSPDEIPRVGPIVCKGVRP